MAHIDYSKHLKQAMCSTYSKVYRHKELRRFFFLLTLENQAKKFKIRPVNFGSSIIVLIM